jgi:hypothetical protein
VSVQVAPGLKFFEVGLGAQELQPGLITQFVASPDPGDMFFGKKNRVVKVEKAITGDQVVAEQLPGPQIEFIGPDPECIFGQLFVGTGNINRNRNRALIYRQTENKSPVLIIITVDIIVWLQAFLIFSCVWIIIRVEIMYLREPGAYRWGQPFSPGSIPLGTFLGFFCSGLADIGRNLVGPLKNSFINLEYFRGAGRGVSRDISRFRLVLV